MFALLALPCRTVRSLCGASSRSTGRRTAGWAPGWSGPTSSGEAAPQQRRHNNFPHTIWFPGCGADLLQDRQVPSCLPLTLGDPLPLRASLSCFRFQLSAVIKRRALLAALPCPGLNSGVTPVSFDTLPCSYMAVLRHGGVYADVDAECRRPLDSLLHSKDTLVAGWDSEWANATAALQAG